MGKRVQMKFKTIQSGSCEWFDGVISSYDGCDNASLDDDDLDIID